jgi:hypothetical protein
LSLVTVLLPQAIMKEAGITVKKDAGVSYLVMKAPG